MPPLDLKKFKVSFARKYESGIDIDVFARNKDEAVVVALNNPEAKKEFKGLMPPFVTVEPYVIPEGSPLQP